MSTIPGSLVVTVSLDPRKGSVFPDPVLCARLGLVGANNSVKYFQQ